MVAELRGSDEAEPWRIEGEGVSLEFAPAGPTTRGDGAEDGLESVDQLCSVTGSVVLGGGQHQITCLGWRATVGGAFELDAIDSFRQTSGWFEAAHGISMVALRPRKLRAHDDDLVAAALLEPDALRVDDPRLSTTYDASGRPTRVGLELWLESEASDEASDEDSDRQFPRRAAAEAVGSGIEWETAGFTLHAAALRWHSRGSDGAGVYLLGRRG